MKKEKLIKIFDYYIKQEHCKKERPNMQIKNMCHNCYEAYWHKASLVEIRDEIIKKIKI